MSAFRGGVEGSLADPEVKSYVRQLDARDRLVKADHIGHGDRGKRRDPHGEADGENDGGDSDGDARDNPRRQQRLAFRSRSFDHRYFPDLLVESLLGMYPAALPPTGGTKGATHVPAYDFKCTCCDLVYEVVRPAGQANPGAVPQCGGDTKRVFSPVGVVFKGSGFPHHRLPDPSRATTNHRLVAHVLGGRVIRVLVVPCSE